jgi:cell wall-associated NlpC family hydrolase
LPKDVAMSGISAPLLLLRTCLVAALVAACCLGGTGSADALTKHQRHRVLHVAASKKGTPYRYGATGPHAFDCSGYTRWVFARIGRHLPRTSRGQYHAVRHVRRSHRRRGDLVFFLAYGRVYHVGIYAGHGRIWHAPYPGQRVHRERLWTRHVRYGRVR